MTNWEPALRMDYHVRNSGNALWARPAFDHLADNPDDYMSVVLDPERPMRSPSFHPLDVITTPPHSIFALYYSANNQVDHLTSSNQQVYPSAIMRHTGKLLTPLCMRGDIVLDIPKLNEILTHDGNRLVSVATYHGNSRGASLGLFTVNRAFMHGFEALVLGNQECSADLQDSAPEETAIALASSITQYCLARYLVATPLRDPASRPSLN